MPKQLSLNLDFSFCFTGFSAKEKAELIKCAVFRGHTVKKSVTKKLDYLVIGMNAGKSKMKKASLQNTKIKKTDVFLTISPKKGIPYDT